MVNPEAPVADASPPEVIDSQGKDEMNLAEFPIAALTDYVPKGQNTIRFGDSAGSLRITGSDAYGLPTAADADVVVALIQITKRRSNFSEPTVHFSRKEILEILGWPESGKAYRRLTESLYRWSTTSLHFEGTWWDNRARRKMNAVFHILNEVVLFERGEKALPAPLSYFTWNKIFLESCQTGNLKRLDLRMYFALEHASSKRLYRFLDKRLHRQPDQTFDLAEIAFERVGLSRGYVGKKGGVNVAKVREKLQPAIDELEAQGFLVPMAAESRYSRGEAGWSVRFVRTGDAAEGPDGPGDGGEIGGAGAVAGVLAGLAQGIERSRRSALGPKPRAAKAAAEQVAALVARGVTPSRAGELLAQHPAARVVEKVEIFDWRVARKDTRGLSKNPAGWLVKAVEDDYPAPKGFESAAGREARLAAERAKEQAAAEAGRASKRRDRDSQAVDDHIKRLGPEGRAAAEAEALAAAAPEVRRDVEGAATPAFRKALLLGLLREHVADKLKREQPTLF